MTASEPLVIALAILAAAVAGLLAATVVPRLPEPAAEDADGKPPYASLVSLGFVAQVTLAAGVAFAIAVMRTPPPTWLAWSGLAIVGSLAISVDARTTWIPRRLTSLLALWIGLGLVVASVGQPQLAVRAAFGGLVLRAFFYLFYLPRNGIGFADVRLMTWVGALTATQADRLVMAATLCGSLLGAVWGVVHHLRRPHTPFPYGPGLWAGVFVALLLTR